MGGEKRSEQKENILVVAESGEQVTIEAHLSQGHEDLGLYGSGLRGNWRRCRCGLRHGLRNNWCRRSGRLRSRLLHTKDGSQSCEGVSEDFSSNVGQRSGIDHIEDSCRLRSLGIDVRLVNWSSDDIICWGFGSGGHYDLDPQAVAEVGAIRSAESPVTHVSSRNTVTWLVRMTKRGE